MCFNTIFPPLSAFSHRPHFLSPFPANADMLFSFKKEDNSKKLWAKWSMKMNRRGLLTEFDVGGDIANFLLPLLSL